MKLGIVGLPNVGKSTLFNALTGSHAETGSYSNAAMKPNVGQAKVPDERLDWLAEYYHPKKYSPATIEFVDVAGVSAGGKGNEVFQAIRQVDALVEVVRCFDNEDIFLEPADAVRDAESFELELILADIEIVERRLDTREEERQERRQEVQARSGDVQRAARPFVRREARPRLCLYRGRSGHPDRRRPSDSQARDLCRQHGRKRHGDLCGKRQLIGARRARRQGAGAAVLPVAAKFEEDIADSTPRRRRCSWRISA